jgi:hypothetical protein
MEGEGWAEYKCDDGEPIYAVTSQQTMITHVQPHLMALTLSGCLRGSCVHSFGSSRGTFIRATTPRPRAGRQRTIIRDMGDRHGRDCERSHS